MKGVLASGARLAGRLLLAVLLVATADAAVFRTAYHRVLDPLSSTGSFEAMLDRERARAGDRQRDVLVIGDSRIVEALWARRASASAGGLRVINAAVPGTTPRCWYYFLRDDDPQAARYRAIVIPFDTYDDLSTAIGAPDAADHIADLHYVVYRLRPADWFDFAMSMQWNRPAAFLGELLPGFVLKNDVQAFLADPPQRLASLTKRDAAFPPESYAGRTQSLRGLRYDGQHLVFPAGIPEQVRADVTHRVLDPPRHDAEYAAYRMRWIGRILARYASTGTRVIFVRVPSMPLVLHKALEDPDSSIRRLARRYHTQVMPGEDFAGLERPEYFNDHAHLDSAGRAVFSDRFGRSLARALER